MSGSGASAGPAIPRLCTFVAVPHFKGERQMAGQLTGRVALITGASSGIGRAAARLFAAEGARLLLAARREAELEQLAQEIRAGGGEAWALAGDVVDEAYAQALVQEARRRWGRLDVAFNNAGTMGPLCPSTEIRAEDWRRALDVNLGSALLAAKHQIPALLDSESGGSLIFTGTFVGYTAGFPGAAAYAASKAGLIGLGQALAAEYGPQGLRVNTLLPGGTDTPMAQEMNGTPEALAQVARLHALRRIAQPEEIARAALFLASTAASFVTGSALLVDGGVSIQKV